VLVVITMRRIVLFVLMSLPAYAQMMGGYEGSMMGGWSMGTIGLLYLAVGSAVFSAIFWWMHNLIADKK
jgi:hypothetical protein